MYGEAGHNRFRKGRQPFNLTEYEWKGGRVVECGRLEICCTASQYREFESPPFRQKQHSERGVFLLGKQWGETDDKSSVASKAQTPNLLLRFAPLPTNNKKPLGQENKKSGWERLLAIARP